MKNLCIIPARGGSKRIPRKNIKSFLGKPIIYYSIEAAKSSGLFEEIMVSTDDIEIAEIAKSFGVQIPFLRSVETSSDYATTIDVLLEVIKGYKAIGREFDNICCIYPCAPLLQVKKLNLAYEVLIEKKMDIVLPIIKYSTPIQRAFKIVGDKIDMLYPEMKNTRSQDLENSYFDAGQFYWANTLKLLSQKTLHTKNTGSILLDEIEAHDIDNEIDWKITEIKYSLL